MLIFLPLGLVAFFVVMWFLRRGSTLTRTCRWREAPQDVTAEGVLWRCVACGAETRRPKGRTPRDCPRLER